MVEMQPQKIASELWIQDNIIFQISHPQFFANNSPLKLSSPLVVWTKY